MNNLTTIEDFGYCNFLSPKGRVLFDAFVAAVDGDQTLLEVEPELVKELQKHVLMYSLRKKQKLSLEEEYVHAVHVTAPAEDPTWREQGMVVLKDSRMPDAWRVYCRDSDLSNFDALADRPDRYETLRILNGVGEGKEDLGYNKSIPLQNNLDYQEGVSFSKGCYLGQELIARAHNVGVVRKRFTPMIIGTDVPTSLVTPSEVPKKELQMEAIKYLEETKGSQEVNIQIGDSLVTAKGKTCGQVVRVSSEFPNLAMVMLRQQYLEGTDPLFVAEKELESRPLLTVQIQ